MEDISIHLNDLRNSVDRLRCMDVGHMLHAGRNLYVDTAIQCERLAVKFRELALTVTPVEREKYLLKVADAQGVTVNMEGQVFHATLPAQLPGRYSKNTVALVQPFMAALRDLAAGQKIRRFEKAAVCFVYVYSQKSGIRQVRDHDNIENKQIIDALSSYLLKDDNGLLCSQHHWSELGEKSITEVYVMPEEYFSEWAKKRKE